MSYNLFVRTNYFTRTQNPDNTTGAVHTVTISFETQDQADLAAERLTNINRGSGSPATVDHIRTDVTKLY